MRKKTISKLIATLISLTLIFSVSASAAAADVSIMASDYLSYYSATAYADPGGEVEVWFDVNATGYMDYVGASNIIIQRYENGSWTGVHTYFASSTSGMLATNAIMHVGHIAYQGVPGLRYRAMVVIYASNSNGSDYRTIYTNAVYAY